MPQTMHDLGGLELMLAEPLPSAAQAQPAPLAPPPVAAPPPPRPRAAAPAPEVVAEAPPPRRREQATLSLFDRARMAVAAAIVWAFGAACTVVAIRSVGVSWAAAVVLAAIVQFALSAGQVSFWRVPALMGGMVSRLWGLAGAGVGLIFLVADAGVNAYGLDLMLPLSVPADLGAPMLWVALGLGVLIAAIPEVLIAILQGRR